MATLPENPTPDEWTRYLDELTMPPMPEIDWRLDDCPSAEEIRARFEKLMAERGFHTGEEE